MKTFKKQVRLFLFVLTSVCISCSTTEDDSTNQKSIVSFIVNGIEGTIDNSKNTITIEGSFLGVDLTIIKPKIVVSEGATVSPASEETQNFTSPVTYTVTAEDKTIRTYIISLKDVKCPSGSTICTFGYNGKKYELVRERKNWKDAAAFAVSRGGYLAEINTAEEQKAIQDELLNNGKIDISQTTASDGGGASYVWLGGNDIESESNWVWNGNNDTVTIPFWKGAANGNAVDEAYTNWGREPDNFNGTQDALAFALTNWPFGSRGQWNDVNEVNGLYFLIEYDKN